MNRATQRRFTFIRVTPQAALQKVRVPTEWDDALSIALRSIELSRGLTFALAPTISRTLTEKDLNSTLPEMSGAAGLADEVMSEFILQFLTQDDAHVALIQTNIWEGDPCLQQTDSPWIFLPRGIERRAVCVFQHRDNATLDTLVAALQERRYATFIVVLSSLPFPARRIVPEQSLDKSIVEHLASNAGLLIVDCFDGDSYLVWALPESARLAGLKAD